VPIPALRVINIRRGRELRTIKDMATIKRRLALLFLLVCYTLLGRDFGPPVGAKMAGFELPDQDGKVRTLGSLLGPKGAVILFYQSADWCPYCKAQLVELEQNQTEFRDLGLGIAAISYDSVAVLHNFAERRGIHFPLLSDRDSKVIRELGILNETTPTDNPFFGVPYPGSFVLDAQGVITAKYFEDDFRERYTSADILAHQFGVQLQAARSEVEGKQLKLEASASNALVGAGQRVSLTLDIEMKPNMHVYAPGVEDNYIPINWKMKESDAAAAHEVSYPPSEKLHLAAIDETVPVYRDHFRLSREITIAQDAKLRPALNSSGKFTVEGTLRYQACDDRVCYIPQELPVKWTFQYAEFDKERAPVELRRK
jgi:peroxiredoxin